MFVLFFGPGILPWAVSVNVSDPVLRVRRLFAIRLSFCTEAEGF
jgi:hypothetical protein